MKLQNRKPNSYLHLYVLVSASCGVVLRSPKDNLCSDPSALFEGMCVHDQVHNNMICIRLEKCREILRREFSLVATARRITTSIRSLSGNRKTVTQIESEQISGNRIGGYKTRHVCVFFN